MVPIAVWWGEVSSFLEKADASSYILEEGRGEAGVSCD